RVYGHVGSVLPLAMRLQERGHEIVFALRDLSHAERFLARRGFALLQAPVWMGDKRGPELPVSYADMLANFGFPDRAGLTAMVRAWRGLYALVRPDLLMIDHGPTALLAARRTGPRRVLFRSGAASPCCRRPSGWATNEAPSFRSATRTCWPTSGFPTGQA